MIVNNPYSLSHLSDDALLHALSSLIAQDRVTVSRLLAHLAECDNRKLYLPQGYSSMHAYCVGALGLSEETTFKRIRAARAARKFPAIFDMVSDGRLHLSAIVMLHHYLTPENANDLLAAAVHRTKAELERLLAERFPRLELSSGLTPIPTRAAEAPCQDSRVEPELSPGTVAEPIRARSPRIEAIAPQRYTFQVTIDQETHDLLDRARDLLGHRLPSGDLAAVVAVLVRLGVEGLERRRFSAAERPRRARESTHPRHIPAHVRRAVWHRDEGRCTFRSDSGCRCRERKRLEFDHAVPFARGGRSTVENLRLRCRAHNQYEAERVYGTRFMEAKRQKGAETVERTKARGSVEEVIPWLRGLGLRADQARRAAEQCESIPDAPLEVRVKRALAGWGPRGVVRIPCTAPAPIP